MAGRQRDVAGEECPKCGSPPGEKCKSYKGRGIAPHVIHDRPAGPAAGDPPRGQGGESGGPHATGSRDAAVPAWTQGELFTRG